MNRCVIYARQSKTRDGSESIDTQIEACRRAAERMGFEVVEVLSEAPSTSGYQNRGKSRKEFQVLLSGFGDGKWDMVMAYKTDRLSRGGGPGWAPLLDEIEGAKLDLDHSVATPSGFVSEFEIGIRASMDREESKKLSERMSDIAARKAIQGRPQGGRRPFGYQRDMVTLDPTEAPVLKRMGEMLLKGESYKHIAYWLNEQGYRTTTGKLWYPVTVRNSLRRPRYAGIRVHEGVEYKGVWDPIFTYEEWKAIQLVMKSRKDKAGERPIARKYLLTGLVVCGKCANFLNGETKRDIPSRPLRRVYYCRVQGDSAPGKGCGGVTRNADALEHFIRELICHRLDTSELASMLESQEDTTRLSELLKERDLIVKRKDGLIDDYADGTLDKAALTRAQARVERRLCEIDGRLDELRLQRVNVALSAGESVRDAWMSHSDGWRFELASALIERIVVQVGKAKPFYDVDGLRMRFDPSLIDVQWKV